MEKYKKQHEIIAVLEARIKKGEYSVKLPKSSELAAEFKVNFKTIDKAVNKLAKKGVVVRKRRAGTLVVDKDKEAELDNNLIETLFVGSSEISLHPYYSEVWRGLLDGLSKTKYKLVMTMLEADMQNGGLKKACHKFTPAVARILLGNNSAEQIDILKKQKEPFILVGEKSYDNTPAVHASIFKPLKHIFKKLLACGHEKIAYIGPAASKEDEKFTDLGRFYAYISAIKDVYGSIDYSLIADIPPLANQGYPAMKALLEKFKFDVVFVAFDYCCPGVYRAIKEHGLNIPDDISVLSQGSSNIHLFPELFSLKVDGYKIGLEGAKLIKKVINNRTNNRNIKSVIVEYETPSAENSSIRLT